MTGMELLLLLLEMRDRDPTQLEKEVVIIATTPVTPDSSVGIELEIEDMDNTSNETIILSAHGAPYEGKQTQENS
jgi:hypothetical protein